MKSRIHLVIGAGILASALALSACSSSPATTTAAPQTLELQTDLTAGSAALKSLTEVTDGFEKANPSITINLVPGTATYEADLKVRLASGDVPDIWSTHGWSLLRYSKFLLPLNNEPWAKYFNPALNAAMTNSKGQFFAFPVATDVAGIVYNKKVLADNHIDVSTLTTWAAFTQAAVKLKAAGITPIGSSGKDNWLAGNIADWIAPGAYTSAQLKQFQVGKFQSAGYADILTLAKSWADDGLFNPDYSSAVTSDLEKQLAVNKLAFVLAPNYVATETQTINPDAELGYMPVPSLQGGTPYLIGGEGGGGQSFGISKTSPHIDAAKSYLDYLAQPANESKLAQAAGTIPGLTNAKSDLGKLQPSYDKFVKSGKYPLVPYFDRVYMPNGAWDTMVSSMDAQITKQGTVSAGVDQVKTAFASLYGQK